jgi:hypothetical protein
VFVTGQKQRIDPCVTGRLDDFFGFCRSLAGRKQRIEAIERGSAGFSRLRFDERIGEPVKCVLGERIRVFQNPFGEDFPL